MAKTSAKAKAALPVFEMVMTTNAILRGELYPAAAPETAGNFIALANAGFYDGLSFHRCLPGFIVQGGKPEKPLPYCVKGEFEFNGDKLNKLPHQYGSLCLSRGNHYDSGASEFYIVLTRDVGELNCLDGAYAVFGQVTEGMKAAEAIGQLATDEQDQPLQPQVIRRIRVETFGADYPFTKLPPPARKVNVPVIKHRGQK